MSDPRSTVVSFTLYLFSIVERILYLLFFFNDTATTEIYTLSLHDALPISPNVLVLRIESEAMLMAPEPQRDPIEVRRERRDDLGINVALECAERLVVREQYHRTAVAGIGEDDLLEPADALRRQPGRVALQAQLDEQPAGVLAAMVARVHPHHTPPLVPRAR